MYAEIWRYSGDDLFYVLDSNGDRIRGYFPTWQTAVEWATANGYHNREWCERMMRRGCQWCERFRDSGRVG